MPLQAIGMALVASVYPLGLAVVLLLARAGPRPRSRVVVFVIGAAACTFGVGLAVVFVLRGAGLARAGQQPERDGLRLAAGLALLVAAAVATRWRPRQGGGQSRVLRAAERGGLIAAFLAGIALYLPSPFYLSALQEVGASNLSVALQVLWVLLLVALVLITIEVPALLLMLSPGRTVSRLEAVDAWLTRHRRILVVAVLAALGVWLSAQGAVGLIGQT